MFKSLSWNFEDPRSFLGVKRHRIQEMHPGNYIYYDTMQESLGVSPLAVGGVGTPTVDGQKILHAPY